MSRILKEEIKLLKARIEKLEKKNTYSAEETKAGKWINGKTLYRKIITTSAPSTTKDGSWADNKTKIADDIETAFVEWGFITNTINQRQPIPYTNNSGYSIKAFVDYDKELHIASSYTMYNDANVVFSVLYTKTTNN